MGRDQRLEVSFEFSPKLDWSCLYICRFAMLAYGEKSPIGSKLGYCLFHAWKLIPAVSLLIARQERLLQGLMREIVRMTAHKQPLEVGAPLYPFSSSSLWRKGNSNVPEDGTAGLPMPANTIFDEDGHSRSTPPEFHSAPGWFSASAIGTSHHSHDSSYWIMFPAILFCIISKSFRNFFPPTYLIFLAAFVLFLVPFVYLQTVPFHGLRASM